MTFPPAFLDELRARLTLSEIVGKRVKLLRAGREMKGCCPFHNEKSPSFYVNDDKQFFHCFGCGAHGDIIGFTMRHDRLSFPEAVESLAGQAGLQVPRDTPVERERFDREKRLHHLLERATVFYEEQLFATGGREALAYLRHRGLSDDAIRRFRLGYAPNDGQSLLRKLAQEGFKIDELMEVGLAKKAEDRNDHYSFFRNRVMFPVGDRRGQTVAFGGRVLGDGEPKYLNSPDHVLFHKGQLLYGLSRARSAIGHGQPLIVVEGYMDVIALVEAGYTGAVAPLGTALTEDQMKALWRLLPPGDARDPGRDYSPVLCFDGDNAGIRAAARAVERALPLLTPTQTIRIATITGAKDPDDLLRASGKAAMDAVIAAAQPMVETLWTQALTGRPLRTPEERGALIAALKQRVGRIADEGLRQLYHQDIQKRLNDAFNWQAQTQPRQQPTANWSAGKPRAYGKGGYAKPGQRPSWRPPEPEGLMARKQPPQAQSLRERALLATIINYPELFDEIGEDLAQTGFNIPEFELLRQRVIEILSDQPHQPLDGTELYRHLSESGSEGFYPADPKIRSFQASLADVLSESTYMHAGFARPDRGAVHARQGWKSIWNKYLQEQLHNDLQRAKRHYAEAATEENLARLMALRGQFEVLLHESGESAAESGYASLKQGN